MGKVKIIFFALMFTLVFSVTCFAFPLSTVTSLPHYLTYSFGYNDLVYTQSVGWTTANITRAYWQDDLHTIIVFSDDLGNPVEVDQHVASRNGNSDYDNATNEATQITVSSIMQKTIWADNPCTILGGNIRFYNSKALLLADKPLTPQEIVDEGNYVGMVILKPDDGVASLNTVNKFSAMVRVPVNISWAPNGPDQSKQLTTIYNKIKKDFKLTVNGAIVNISPIFDIVKHDNSGFYVVSIKGAIPSTNKGSQVIVASSSFLTSYNMSFFGIDNNDYTFFSNTVTYNVGSPESGSGAFGDSDVLPKDGDKPQLDSDKYSGIFGPILFAIDTIGYYITLPFKSIGEVFAHLFEALGSVTTSFGGVQLFIQALFSFLPLPIIYLMETAITFTVIGVFLRTFGRK
jgi:hypothetical protein